MRLFWVSSASNGESTATSEAERRLPVTACWRCEQFVPPWVYLEDKHDYCVRCAVLMRWQAHLRTAGRREGDIIEVDTP